MKYTVGWIVFGLLVIFGGAWAVEGNDFFMTKYFAPKEEAVRRQVFEESKAYNDGMAQQLEARRLDYAKAATPEQRQAIGSVVLHMFAGYDKNQLTADDRLFLDKVQAEQTVGAR